MRSLLTILILVLGCAYSNVASGKGSTNKMNGTWVPVKQEMGGKELPNAAFEGQKLIIKDSTYGVTAESADKGKLTYKDGKMDIYGKHGVNAGKHFMAIYKLEDGALTICYNLKGDSYPQDYETKSSPMLFLSVFKKQATK